MNKSYLDERRENMNQQIMNSQYKNPGMFASRYISSGDDQSYLSKYDL